MEKLKRRKKGTPCPYSFPPIPELILKGSKDTYHIQMKELRISLGLSVKDMSHRMFQLSSAIYEFEREGALNPCIIIEEYAKALNVQRLIYELEKPLIV